MDPLAGSGPKGQPEKESYATSARNLGASFVVAWWAADRFETSSLAAPVASYITAEGMGASNIWVYGAACLYFGLVMWHLFLRSASSKALAKQSADEAGSLVGRVLVLWNFLLSFFSMVMFFGMGRGALKVFAAKGFVNLICDGSTMFLHEQPFSMYLVLFALSKFPELFDTVLLVVRGRDIRFLHWYHHLTVLLYCWLAMQAAFPSGLFGIINAFVHSVMYYYYARSGQGVRLRFAKFITVIQLSQMVAGLVINGVFVALYTLTSQAGGNDARLATASTDQAGGVCDGGEKVREDGTMRLVLGCTAVMYASYLALFGQFYLQRWMNKTK
jgi:hypothetical protein